MVTYNLFAGSTDVSVVCRAVDSVDGTPETAFDHATAGIDLKYRREGAANVDITEAALAALTTVHTDGGVEQIGNGYFRLDLPDAAVAAGASGVLVHGVATGVVIIGCYINLDPIPVDVRELAGDGQSLTDLKDFADAGYDPATNKVQGVVLTDTLTTYTGNTLQTGDSFARLGAAGAGLTAVPWNAAWDAEVQSEATDALNAYDPPTNAEMVARTIAAADYATAAAVDAIDNFVDTEITAMKGVLDKLDTAMELDGAVYRFTVNALELAPTGGSAPTVVEIANEVQTRTIAAVTLVNGLAANTLTAAATAADFTTEVTAGLATTANVAAVETKVDGVKAKTDTLTFTIANVLDANIQRINDVVILGDGQPGNKFRV